eukprot:1143119-Pelagomonas_calceolata.AAC.4
MTFPKPPCCSLPYRASQSPSPSPRGRTTMTPRSAKSTMSTPSKRQRTHSTSPSPHQTPRNRPWNMSTDVLASPGTGLGLRGNRSNALVRPMWTAASVLAVWLVQSFLVLFYFFLECPWLCIASQGQDATWHARSGSAPGAPNYIPSAVFFYWGRQRWLGGLVFWKVSSVEVCYVLSGPGISNV